MATKTIITEGESKEEKRNWSNSWVRNQNIITSSLEQRDFYNDQ